MSKSQENLKDVTLICERVIWYLKQKPEELIEYLKEHRLDALYSISDPNRGMIICGLEASKRFTDIAKRFVSTQEEKKRKANLSKFIGNLKEEFSRIFIQRGEEISQRNIDRMIASAYKRTSKKFESIRHFVPCAIFLTKNIKSFEVGPVQFLHESKFFDSYKEEIQALREEIKVDHQAKCRSAVSEGFPEDRIATEKQSEHLANRLVDGLLDFYTQYEWFAVVDIVECDSTVSYDKAVFTTKTALNILKLLLGGQYTDRLRTAQDYDLPHKSAKLTRGADGKLDISLSNIPGGNVLGDDWFEFLSTKAEYFFKLASRALAFSVEFSEIPPLCTRFIDSLSWYGDAILEKSPAAKIVKYVSSIERMTGTGIESDENGNKRRVTEIVTSRSSILYSNATGKSLVDCFREVNHIYECRSNLLHGSISPFDDSVVSDSYKAEEISRLILLTGLDFFNSLGLDNPTMNQRQLRGYYNDLEKMHLQTKKNNA